MVPKERLVYLVIEQEANGDETLFAIYDTRQKAERYIEKFPNKDRDLEVEEWAVD